MHLSSIASYCKPLDTAIDPDPMINGLGAEKFTHPIKITAAEPLAKRRKMGGSLDFSPLRSP